jgi:hypothetical protein
VAILRTRHPGSSACLLDPPPVWAQKAPLSEAISLRSPHYLYVCEKLTKEHDPKSGISGLPDEARDAIYDIAYYYQIFASLIRTGIVDEETSLAFIRGRVIRVWEAISPYVIREREITAATGPHLLQILEDFAAHAQGTPTELPSAVLTHHRESVKDKSQSSPSAADCGS